MKEITAVFNVRINSELRLANFVESVKALLNIENLNFSIRIRGNLAEESLFRMKQILGNQRVNFYGISNYKSWNIDTYEQILEANSECFLLLQEDHFLIADPVYLVRVIEEFRDHKCDFMPLSFFPHHGEFLELLEKVKPGKLHPHLKSFALSKGNLQQIPINKRNYLINLIGLFNRKTLIKILLTERPFIKSFNIKTPFNFEQKEKETWFLPIIWAFPNRELFACTDDDHGIEGYSLASRFGNREGLSRKIEHHLSDNQKPEILSKREVDGRFSMIAKHHFRLFRYSLYAIITLPKRKLIIRSLNKRIRSV
jgi:hypothetical protein